MQDSLGLDDLGLRSGRVLGHGEHGRDDARELRFVIPEIVSSLVSMMVLGAHEWLRYATMPNSLMWVLGPI